jgi:hypothetical protein
MAATCPMHRDKGSAAVFKGLSRRILDLADLRKLPREWPFHRVLGPSRTPCRDKRFQRFRSVGAAGEMTWPTAVSSYRYREEGKLCWLCVGLTWLLSKARARNEECSVFSAHRSRAVRMAARPPPGKGHRSVCRLRYRRDDGSGLAVVVLFSPDDLCSYRSSCRSPMTAQ